MKKILLTGFVSLLILATGCLTPPVSNSNQTSIMSSGSSMTNPTLGGGGNPVSTNDICVVSMGDDTYTHSGNRTLLFDTIVHDSGGNFNTATYTYTAPERRMYYVSVWARAAGTSHRRAFRIVANGVYAVISDYYTDDADTYVIYETSCVVFLEAGETIYTVVYPYTSDVDMMGGGPRSRLMIIPVGE